MVYALKYLLLIPKCSLKEDKELIKLFDGFWNGIGYAFPEQKKPIVKEWLSGKDIRALVEVDWDGSWDEYRTFVKDDWDYIQLIQTKLEIHCLNFLEETDDSH